MIKMDIKLTLILPFLFCICAGYAQDTSKVAKLQPLPSFGIKTNLLYDATATINLGIEFGLGEKTSLDIPVSYNPWTFDNNKKWKHILVQPEFRWWTGDQRFKGSFWGLHAHYAYYNVGALDSPPFSEYMNQHRFQGWLVGAGVSYGYRWNFSEHWGMEATLGLGYAYLSYDKYTCQTCGTNLGHENKNYFGPTKAGLSLIYSFGGKKKAVPTTQPVIVPVEIKEPEPTIPYEPKLIASNIVPDVETIKKRSEAGKAYLDFSIGTSIIKPNYKNNASELTKINDLITQLQHNPDATITGITITGYSSPDGTYSSNMRLSNLRAIALKDHIKTIYGFNETFFTVSGEGEDWPILDALVSKSDRTDKDALLAIIRSTDAPDSREKKLKNLSGGAPYRQMSTELFPQLRRADYELNYTVKPFTVEQGKEVFKTSPGQLSLNEMFMIAQTYEKGSPEFDEIFETAARIFPTSDVANLNAAASALDRKDVQSAQKYLNKLSVKSTAYYNNMGVLSFLEGDKEKAIAYFKNAEAAGNLEAKGNIDEIGKQ